jgi:ABC-type multidrug transport system ATPase subunit
VEVLLEGHMKSGAINLASLLSELPDSRAFEFSCRNVRFGYGAGVEVLKGIDLTLPKHHMGVIFGRSGVGKTTLLKCITGYLAPTTGTIDWSSPSKRILGSDETNASVSHSRARELIALWEKIEGQKSRRRRGVWERLVYAESTSSPMVFADSANALPQLTVVENLKCVLAPVCKDFQLRERTISLVLAITDLAEARFKRPQQLSSGQLKRLCLAQSLAVNPRLLVWDEPTAGLDSATKYELLSFIQTIRSLVDVPGVLVTHDIEAALLLADEIYLFHNGRIIKTLEVGFPQPRRPEELANAEYRPLHFELVQFLKS